MPQDLEMPDSGTGPVRLKYFDRIIQKSVKAAIKDLTVMTPYRLPESQAAVYSGRSKYWLRNLRKADDFRESQGGERLGPPVEYEGKTPFYLRPRLDSWLANGGLGDATDALVIPKYQRGRQ